MSLMDKVVAAVTPEATDEERAQARANARAEAGNGSWLAMVLDHHVQIEAAFAAVKAGGSAGARRAAQKMLAVLLTGHSIAEETVLYPSMALSDQKGHSTAAYTEQSAAKVQLAALDELDPMSQDYLDKLEHLRAAVAHHVYEEESKWFPELQRTGDSIFQTRLTGREDVVTLLYHLGFKVVRSDMKCYPLDYVQALHSLAKLQMQNGAPALDWGS